MKACWVAQLNMATTPAVSQKARPTTMAIARKSGLGWNKAPRRCSLTMLKAHLDYEGIPAGLKPQYTYEQFVAAGAAISRSFRRLEFRITTLDKDLIEVPVTGVATIMPDEFSTFMTRRAGHENYKP